MMKYENREMLSMEEVDAITGANWLTDAVNAACNWIDDNKKAVMKGVCVIGGIALCATGIGAGAGLGLIAVESVAAAAFSATAGGTIIGAAAGAIVTQDWED